MSPQADALGVLNGWDAPDAAQESLRQEFVAFLETHADGTDRSCRAGHLTASTLVLQPSTRRVLLTHHALVGRWLQLGGHCEPGDADLGAAAVREAREESGVAGLTVSAAPLRLDRHEVNCRWSGGSDRLAHLDGQYLALAEPEVDVRAEGDAPLRWFDVDALPEDTDDAVRALVRAAVSSLPE